MVGSPSLRLVRAMVLLLLLAILAGPVGAALGDWVDEGGASISSFGLLLVVVNLVLAKLGKDVERLVFSTKQRPWQIVRLHHWQSLILRHGTDTLITLGMSTAMAGGAVLLASGPAWSSLDVVALGFVLFGGALIGFALSRLVVGLLVFRRSGLGRASQRAWMIAAAIIALGTALNAIYSIVFVLQIAPAL